MAPRSYGTSPGRASGRRMLRCPAARVALRLQGTSHRWLAHRSEVIFLPGSPRRALSPATATDLSDCRFLPALPCSSPPPSRPPPLISSAPRLPLHRRCGCRGNGVRRLRDYLQSELACLPLQRLDLLLLHLGLVLLLTLTHVRHPVLQRQIDDPC